MEVINWRLKFQRRVQGSTRRCFVEKISMLESMYEIYHQVATIQKTSLAMERKK